MSNIDRNLQLSILNQLSDVYPNDSINYMTNPEDEIVSHPNFLANVAYLKEHGLIDYKPPQVVDVKGRFLVANVVITKDGLDFLEDDGGVSAIKKTIFIRPSDVEDFLNLLKDRAEILPEPHRNDVLKAVTDFSTPVAQGVLQTVLNRLLDMG